MNNEAHELKIRLDCRNNLLDLIRKAYHRDVLVIREFLLQLENGVNVSDIKAGDLNLRSLPSIDLRNEGFHLFSPQECELSIKPCFQCGGRLELTHRESSRFMHLMESSNKVKEREKDLEQKHHVALQFVEEQRQAVLKLEYESLEEQTRLSNEIDSLVMRRNELSSLCEGQQNQIQVLLVIRQQKESLDKILAGTNAELLEVEEELQVLRKNNLGLKKSAEDGLNREESFKDEFLKMNNANQELRCNVSTLEELENQLKNELKSCRIEIRRHDDFIRSSKHQIQNLEIKLDETTNERINTVVTLDGKLTIANTVIRDLRSKVSIGEREGAKFREDIQVSMAMREKQEEERATKDQQRNDKLSKRAEELTHLTLSHIQGLYDQCLDEEQILGFQRVLPTTRVTWILSSYQESTPLNYIEDMISQKTDSTRIDWGVVLEDEKERRIVFGNLNNRVLMNLSRIDSFIKRLHTKHDYELNRLKDTHGKRVSNICRTYDEKISILEGIGKDRENRLNEMSKECIDTKRSLASGESHIVTLTTEREEGLETIQLQEKAITKTNETLVNTRSDLDKAKNELKSTKQLLHNARLDLIDRDETLVQLEGLLQKTVERFSKRVKDDHTRLETNVNFGIQAGPAIRDFQQQVHFIKSGSRSIHGQERLSFEKLNTHEKEHYPAKHRFLQFDDDGSIN